MTADVTGTVAPTAALELRARVRAALEEEYLRLRAVDRPALLAMCSAGTADGVDPDVIAREFDVVEERIAALDHHFTAGAADPFGPDHGQVLLLDLGEGPQLMLVSPIELNDDRVIAADSPLGAALRSVVPGRTVDYPAPGGVREVEVLAGESPDALRSTLVVPARQPAAPRGRVVVGVRRVGEAREALAVGFAEANRRGTALSVVLIQDDDRGALLAPTFHAADDRDREAATDLEAAVIEAGRAFPAVGVTSCLRTGHFADVLVDLSRSADLVVLGLGCRPTGMGRRDLLVATHADCPVIVVRETLTEGGS